MREYPELEKLKAFQKAHDIKIQLLGERDELLLVNFESNKGSCELYIQDEGEDYDESNQILCLYLVLKSLEDYKDETDFLAWSNFYGLDDFDVFWLDYYRSLDKRVYEIEFHFGKIDPFINSFDYELRAGAFQELTKK
ncbi:hypothetical protein [Algoriphagus pacificus]|uniref:Uncharacterized protein n=1 Tax=Algoriphagus pacificus TaxID=2811234 RepID=A0ABS3CI37_9BACT|nr:hypothetical protein [Algoriphagus pacificus]MBN7816762.1 hypothetical protein [Algoriphagus pacificus]